MTRIHEADATLDAGDMLDYVVVSIGAQRFGLPILQVQDVFNATRLTRIPLAPACVAGLINLRGKVVTALSLRARLGLPPATTPDAMAVGLLIGQEAFALLVEDVGDVMRFETGTLEPVPRHLGPTWQHCASGVHRLDDGLLAVLNVASVLEIEVRAAA